MDDDRVDYLRLHPVAQGLSEASIRAIAAETEIVRCEPGFVIHRANELVKSVWLVVHGRLRASIFDQNGNVIMERSIVAGGQFGGISAALNEPAPIDCVAVDPSRLLKLDYRRGVALFSAHTDFRLNFVRLVAHAVKSAILHDRIPHRQPAVAFFHQSAATRELTRRLFERLANLGEPLCVLTDLPPPPSTDRIRSIRILGGDAPLDPLDVRRSMAEWLRQGRVFADVDTSVDPRRAMGAFESFAEVYWCVTSENWQASVPRLRTILDRAPSWRDKICVVWLLGAEVEAPVAAELRTMANRDVKVSFNPPAANQGLAASFGFERLVHLLRGVKIGVALGGGAARGMAHLGVLKALEQQGITVDMIAGTSAGAMTGTIYASGMEPDYAISRFVHDMRPTRLFRMLPKGDQWFLLYKYRTGQFDPMLRRHLRDKRFEQLPIPMNAITVDLIGGKAVVRDAGDAVDGILESINLPVLSKPINRDGKSLVDGGLINNVPADVLASKGCNFVIAVSVTAKMETEFATNRPDTPTARMRPASTIQTILRSYLVQSVSINAIGVEPADIVIEPDVTGFQLTEFTRTDELAAIGEKTTLEAMPRIREQLHRLDPQLFPVVPAAAATQNPPSD